MQHASARGSAAACSCMVGLCGEAAGLERERAAQPARAVLAAAGASATPARRLAKNWATAFAKLSASPASCSEADSTMLAESLVSPIARLTDEMLVASVSFTCAAIWALDD